MVHVTETQAHVEWEHIFFPNQEKIELHQPVAKRASILLGELVAIKMALEYVKTEVNKREIKQLSVLSDFPISCRHSDSRMAEQITHKSCC